MKELTERPLFKTAPTFDELLTEFHEATDSFIEVGITKRGALKLRKRLIKEEFKEAMDELKATRDTRDEQKILKELCDLVYVTVGTAVTFGWNFDKAFRKVHASNMSKMDENGKAVRDEGGKVMKGSNYAPPDLSDCV